MKREHEESSSGPPTNGKFKMIEEETDGGVDELLAALGYKVLTSDMADVAQKLEQLDMVMGNSAAAQDEAIITHLASDTVHYNPSNMSTWVESLLSEVNAPPPPLPNTAANNASSSSQLNPFDFQYYPNNESSSMVTGSDLRSDLTAVTAGSSRNQKRQRTTRASSSSSSSSSGVQPAPRPARPQPPSEASSSQPLVLIDSQEAGIRLVHTLMACSEAVQQQKFTAADILVKQISILASGQGGAMRKVANYFAEALSRRIYKLNPHQDYPLESSFSDTLHMHFYESCPYLKFAHFTANQAILEAFEGCKRVHVIDFGMKQGMQWPALLQALAVRPGGPPSFRLTGIGPPQPDNTDALQQVGWKLAQLADSFRVDFEYRGFVASSLSDLEPYMFKSDPNVEIEPEAVAVNSVFELHKLLSRQGAIEKVLNTVKAVKPKIVTVVEQEADHNSDSFSARFTEALHYYSTMFDSLEGGCVSDGGEDQIMAEIYLGKEICNVVACEGLERVERHEKLGQWRRRLCRAGFEPVHLGSNAFKQASMLLSVFAGGDGYTVEEKEGCLTLGWHSRPLIATSAWRVAVDG